MDIYSVTNASGETLSRSDVDELLKEIGISDEAIQTGTDTAIEADATKQGIKDLDTQLLALAQKGGTEVKGSADTVKKDFETKLESLGIPKEIIEKGKDAVIAYAAQNNIKLPEPPSGATLNFVS